MAESLDRPDDDALPSAAELEAAGQDSMFGDSPDQATPPTATAPAQPYRVLARKYRPQTFSELIGQDAMVRTLGNAIKRDRLAHAFLMTGVRGVGKTSTARLIAKALNCIGPDGEGGPTIDPCGECEPCIAIAEGRHIDVIEMDAASHTGVDDVREIIEAVRYSAVSARYKIYIIDEVHMLSRNAFNALLKTLEEPPAHVKFLFATTEVEKLPVTVLSRTQRFDLRRISSEMLADHFAKVCELEGVEAEAEALAIVASAAEGSVRDGLSILDQAIAHADMDGDGIVKAEQVRTMLGLADRSAQRAVLGHLLSGEAAELLAALDEQYALGVEPLAIVRALMDIVHRLTIAKVGRAEPDGASAEERAQMAEWTDALSHGDLHRLWQLLTKGYEEVRQSPDPLISARMALLRAMHAQGLPDPGKLARLVEEMANRAPAATGDQGAAPTAAEPTGQLVWSRWEELVEAVDRSGQLLAASIMRQQVRPLSLTGDTLVFSRDPQYRDAIADPIRQGLLAATGQRYILEERPAGQPEEPRSIAERDADARQSAADEAMAHPLVKATLTAFPDAELLPDSAASGASSPPWRRNA